jgi:parvulin-like peptidyl-prolyl isomerase
MNGDELYEKRVRHGLAAAAVLGLLISLVAATPADRARLNEAGAIAKVNERHIDRTEFASAYQALLSDKTKAPTQGDKKLVLARLIEEELLVQRGLEIGLLDGDAAVRKAVAMAVIEFVLAQEGSDAMSENRLRAFYNKTSSVSPRPAACKWRKFLCPMATAPTMRR